MKYVTEREHHNGLVACQQHREKLTADEYSAINYLCMAYGNNEPIEGATYNQATRAIQRIIAQTRPSNG